MALSKEIQGFKNSENKGVNFLTNSTSLQAFRSDQKAGMVSKITIQNQGQLRIPGIRFVKDKGKNSN